MPQLREPEAVLGDITVLKRDAQIEIQLAQPEVVRHHVADQRRHDAAPALFAGQVLRPRGLGQAAQAAPDVKLPTETKAGLRVTDVAQKTRSRRQLELADLGVSDGAELPVRIQHRELRGALDAQQGAGLQHPLGRDPQVEVLLERRRNELRERIVLEEIDPFEIRQRFRSRSLIRSARPAKLWRDLHRRPLVVRADGAGG